MEKLKTQISGEEIYFVSSIATYTINTCQNVKIIYISAKQGD